MNFCCFSKISFTFDFFNSKPTLYGMGLELITINNLLIMTKVIQSIGKCSFRPKDLKSRETRAVSVETDLRRLRAASGTVLQECWTKQMQEL